MSCIMESGLGGEVLMTSTFEKRWIRAWLLCSPESEGPTVPVRPSVRLEVSARRTTGRVLNLDKSERDSSIPPAGAKLEVWAILADWSLTGPRSQLTEPSRAP